MHSQRTLLFLAAIVVASRGASAVSRSPSALEALSSSFEHVAREVRASVVQIQVSGYTVGRGGADVLTKQQGLGSGTILSADGLVVTNAHVVDRATRIQVVLPPAGAGEEGTKLDAEVIGVDTATDLALLRIPVQGLRPIELGDSGALRQGQLVLAFGSPLGLGNSMTMGVVSAVARQLGTDDVLQYVQTDAPINPGSSGGPLVDSSGRIVGINTMILSRSGGSEGIGLAIPSNVVRSITGQLLASGRVRRGVIGVELQSLTPTMVAALGIPTLKGAIVADLDPAGPAAKADLRVGDVVVAVDGHRVAGVRDFAIAVNDQPIGSTVALDLLRGEQRIHLPVDVTERPEDPTTVLDMVRPDVNLVPELDVLGVDVDDNLTAAMHLRRADRGVLVAAMSADASPPADRFQPGDVIHAVNRTPVHSLADLRKAVAGMKDGDPIVVQIERQGMLTFVTFELD